MSIFSRYKLKTGEEVEPFPPIQNTDTPYASEAAMYADQANQLEGYGYLVDGTGAFTYLGTVAGTAADYEAFGARAQSDWAEADSNKPSFILNKPVDEGKIPFITKWNVAANETITLPVGTEGVNDITVDWGDGTTNAEHSRTYTTAGDKLISITGRLEDFQFDEFQLSSLNLIEIVQWGDIVWKHIKFRHCENLTLIGDDSPNFSNCNSLAFLFNYTSITIAKAATFKYVQNVTDATALIASSLLDTIEVGAFDNFINLVDGASMLRDTKLITLPAQLYKNCSNLTSLLGFLWDTSTFTTIGEDVFIGLLSLRNLSAAFRDTAIQVVPRKLLWSCSELTDVSQMLYGTQVSSLDKDLFIYSPKIVSFVKMCTNTPTFTVPLPAFWMDFPNADGSEFSNKVFSNQSEIPTEWGGTNTDWATNKGTVTRTWKGSQFSYDNVLPQNWKDDITILKVVDGVSINNLDLRASNLAGDLTTAEQDEIKTKLSITARTIKSIGITTTYPVVLDDKIKHLHVGAEFITISTGVFSEGDLLVITCDRSGGSTLSGLNFTSDNILAVSTIKLRLSGTVFLKFISDSMAIAWGDIPKAALRTYSPDGSVWQVQVDDTGNLITTAL